MISQVLILSVVLSVAMSSIHPVLDYKAPQPYSFGYSIKDKHGEQHRQESGDGHSGVKGNYGFVDDRGIKRQVNYVADKLGFRAEVKTNEPGTANQDPAAVKIISTEPYLAGGLGAGALGYGGVGYGGVGLEAGYLGGYGGIGGGGYGGIGGGGLGYGGYGGIGGGGLGYGGYGVY